jgi:hypothetical protein
MLDVSCLSPVCCFPFHVTRLELDLSRAFTEYVPVAMPRTMSSALTQATSMKLRVACRSWVIAIPWLNGWVYLTITHSLLAAPRTFHSHLVSPTGRSSVCHSHGKGAPIDRPLWPRCRSISIPSFPSPTSFSSTYSLYSTSFVNLAVEATTRTIW